MAGFWPGSWLLCTFLQSLQSIATSTTGSLKKKTNQRCVTDASVSAVVYEREANSLSLLWGLTVLGGERDHLLVFISAQALLKTVVKWCFFSELQIKPMFLGGPHSSPIKHVGTYMMVTENENLGGMKYQLTQAGDVCSPGHVNDGYFCGSCSLPLVCLVT